MIRTTKIVIYQKAGRDYPPEFKGRQEYIDAIKLATARRMELRESDTVEVIEED